MSTRYIGRPVSRVDGRQKVTGKATYAAEFEQANVAHGVIVRSTRSNATIRVDRAAAQRAPGVIAVIAHDNAPKLAYRPHKGIVDADVGVHLGPEFR